MQNAHGQEVHAEVKPSGDDIARGYTQKVAAVRRPEVCTLLQRLAQRPNVTLQCWQLSNNDNARSDDLMALNPVCSNVHGLA